MKCQHCRFWSEMIAQCIGGGPVEAMCLSTKSKFHSKYTTARNGCEKGMEGRDIYGAIDAPGSEFHENELMDDLKRPS